MDNSPEEKKLVSRLESTEVTREKIGKSNQENKNVNNVAISNNINNIRSQLHKIQSNVERNKLKKLFKKSKKEDEQSNLNGSFLEIEKTQEDEVKPNNLNLKPDQTSNKEGGVKKNKISFSIESLADSFSVGELRKIKSLIQFAKNNKILDKIYEHSGKVKMESMLPNYSEVTKLKVLLISNFNVKLENH